MDRPAGGLGGAIRDQISNLLNVITGQVDRLEADNIALEAERSKLSTDLATARRDAADAVRQLSGATAVLNAAQLDAEKRIAAAVEQGNAIRDQGRRTAASLRDLADSLEAEANAEADRVEAAGRDAVQAFLTEISLGKPSAMPAAPAASISMPPAVPPPSAQVQPAYPTPPVAPPEPADAIPPATVSMPPVATSMPPAPVVSEPAMPEPPAAAVDPTLAVSMPQTMASVPIASPVEPAPHEERTVSEEVYRPAIDHEPAVNGSHEPAVNGNHEPVVYDLIAAPFTNFSALVSFQKAIRDVPGVSDTRAKLFQNNTLQLSLSYSGDQPIGEALRSLDGFAIADIQVNGNRVDITMSDAVSSGR